MSNRIDGLGAYIEETLDSWHAPGAAVAVIREDDVLYMSGYGLRNIQTGDPVTAHSCFPIASMTKAFTTMGAALLVDEGLMDWDKPLRDVMPEFRLNDEYATQHATLRDLLSHRTGLPRHDAVWYGTGLTHDEIVKKLRYLKPNGTFREKWQYNNMMFEVVGHLTARIAGVENWEELMHQRIFEPLGMTATWATYQGMVDNTDNYAMPYRVKRSTKEIEPIPFYVDPSGSPAGSIHSSLGDLVTWLKVHINAGRSGERQFVSAGNLAQLHKPHMLRPAGGVDMQLFNTTLFAYGLGWFVDPYRG
nr:beta-lactamase family protein [Anaerolineae bacterium]